METKKTDAVQKTAVKKADNCEHKILPIVLATIIITLLVGFAAVYFWQYFMDQEKNSIIKSQGNQINYLADQLQTLQLVNSADNQNEAQTVEPNQFTAPTERTIDINKYHIKIGLPEGYTFGPKNDFIIGSKEKAVAFNASSNNLDNQNLFIASAVVQNINEITTTFEFCEKEGCPVNYQSPQDFIDQQKAWQTGKDYKDMKPLTFNSKKFLVGNDKVIGDSGYFRTYVTFTNNSVNSLRLTVGIWMEDQSFNDEADQLFNSVQVYLPDENDVVTILRKLFATKHDISVENVQIKIESETAEHIRGTVSSYDLESFKAMDYIVGGYFLAAKANNQWKIVIGGNGVIPCELLAANDFPESMKSGCVNVGENYQQYENY